MIWPIKPYEILGLFVAIVLVGISLAWHVPVTIVVNANSEYLAIPSLGYPSPTWTFREVNLSSPCTGSESSQFSGTIRPSPKTSLRIERIANGPLNIEIKGSAPSQVVAIAIDDKTQIDQEVKGCAVIVIADNEARSKLGESVVLMLIGDVKIGHEASLNTLPTSSVLRSGKISFLGQEIFGNGIYEAGSIELHTGDSFAVMDSHGSSRGLLLVNEQPGMTTTFRAVAEQGVVHRFGALGQKAEVSLYYRLKSDTYVIALWSGAGIIIGIVGWLIKRRK
jgi:hypothetical protein